MCAYMGIASGLFIFPTAFTCNMYYFHLQHLKFGSLNNKSLPQQMHFPEWHTRGDFSTAEEHSGKLQDIQKNPGLSYTNTSILLYRKAKNQHICSKTARSTQSSHSTLYISFSVIFNFGEICKHSTKNWKQEHLRKASQISPRNPGNTLLCQLAPTHAHK